VAQPLQAARSRATEPEIAAAGKKQTVEARRDNALGMTPGLELSAAPPMQRAGFRSHPKRTAGFDRNATDRAVGLDRIDCFPAAVLPRHHGAGLGDAPNLAAHIFS